MKLILLLVVVCLTASWVWLEVHYTIDYAGVWSVIKDELMGRKVTCLDLPMEEWTRIEKCWTEEMLQEAPVGGGLDADQV